MSGGPGTAAEGATAPLPAGMAPVGGRGRFVLPLPRQALWRPDHPALVLDGRHTTYGELAARADDLARRLAGVGFEPGDRLAVLLPNRPLVAALVHAAARLGAILVPLNARLTADEIAWQVADAEPRAVICDSGLVERLDGLAPGCVVVVAGRWQGAAGAIGSDWIAMADVAPVDVSLANSVPLDAPATIAYTSGTTGRPKGAVLTHGNHAWSAMASALRLGVLPDDRWLVPLPLYHVGGLAVLQRSALYGTAAVVHGRFDAGAVCAALEGDAITLVSLVPTMLRRVLERWGDRPAPGGLRAILLGGGPAGPALVRRARDLGFPLAPTYGLTEAASQVTTAPPRNAEIGGGGAGPPLACTEVRVVGPDGRDRPEGEAGEILVRGPTVMAGYWNAPGATAEALAGGWLHTGDEGRLDERGELTVLARRSDLVVTGGENVYPAEVEAVLTDHPGVADACVVGVPDPEWGQVVVAAVVPAPGSRLDGPELERFARERLAGFKVPRRFAWLPELPRTAAGKVRRSAVRAWLATDGGD